nr:DUF4113 domain-containing protein [Pantoea stewartii]
MAALDGINRSGKGKVWFAEQGERNSSWHRTDFSKTQAVSCQKKKKPAAQGSCQPQSTSTVLLSESSSRLTDCYRLAYPEL